MKFGQYEGGHRVPTFIAGGALAVGLRGAWHNGTTHLVDLHATVCDLAGALPAQPPAVAPLDGFSLRGILNGSLPPGAQVRDELWMNNAAIRVGDWKLISATGAGAPQSMLGLGGRPVGTPHNPANLSTLSGGSHCSGKETGVDAELCWACKCHSLNMTADPDCRPCLYNLAQDPSEFHNLASSMPAKVEELHVRLRALTASTVRPKWPKDDLNTACAVMATKYGGFFGPWAADEFWPNTNHQATHYQDVV